MGQLHEDLGRICCDSRLEGLRYVGGVAKRTCSTCKKILQYVKFSQGRASKIFTKCFRCKLNFGKDQLLSKVCIIAC